MKDEMEALTRFQSFTKEQATQENVIKKCIEFAGNFRERGTWKAFMKQKIEEYHLLSVLTYVAVFFFGWLIELKFQPSRAIHARIFGIGFN